MVENKLIKKDEIASHIYTIRGFQVMLDRDLATFYEVKPTRLREQVKRNIKRFPSDFMFQLSEEEADLMVSQNAIPSKKHLGGTLPYVFTEQGVASISSVLTSTRAIEINILIMRAFVAMRRFIATNAQIFHRLEAVEKNQITHQIQTDKKFKKVFDAIEEREIIPAKGIFFDGQIFDAYVLISRIVRSANKSIVIIDNYIDETALNLFAKRKKNVMVTIYSKNISKQLAADVEKFNKQYPEVELKELHSAHDRFLIIDDCTIYHIGASLKDLGKKWCAFSKMDIEGLKILNRLKEMKEE